MLHKIFDNCGKPKGILGNLMVSLMNRGHRPLSEWSSSYLELRPDDVILDIGCGGGANIAAFLKACPLGKVYGIDYSSVSVEKSRRVNRAAVDAGRCEIIKGNVTDLPYAAGTFNAVTAFETVYFWPEIAKCFQGIYKILKQGGTFLVVMEAGGEDAKKWSKIVSGMTPYSFEEVADLMVQAGFKNVRVERKKERKSLAGCILGDK